MSQKMSGTVLPAKLKRGDHVVFVSPASTPSRADIEKTAKWLHEDLGLKVEIGEHAFDELGYLAGKDEDRLADLNNALRNPDIKAIFATRGGKGAYRIADGLDFEAARKHPKILVGFSEITILHLALGFWLPGICATAIRKGITSLPPRQLMSLHLHLASPLFLVAQLLGACHAQSATHQAPAHPNHAAGRVVHQLPSSYLEW